MICPGLRSIYGVLEAPGGFAEFLSVHARHTIELPSTLGSVEAAVLVDGGATAANAVRVALARRPARVLVVGAGPIGYLAAEMLRVAGIPVDIVQRSRLRLDALNDIYGGIRPKMDGIRVVHLIAFNIAFHDLKSLRPNAQISLGQPPGSAFGGRFLEREFKTDFTGGLAGLDVHEANDFKPQFERLGAFVQLLADHPLFEISAVAASDRSAGHPFGEVAKWVIAGDPPAWLSDMVVRPLNPDFPAKIVFSALPSSVAREVEPAFARAGYAVCSNASAFRQAPGIPLLIPEINADHVVGNKTGVVRQDPRR